VNDHRGQFEKDREIRRARAQTIIAEALERMDAVDAARP
jgi:hypothetical protein